MLSYENEFKVIQNDPDLLYQAIDDWKTSLEYRKMYEDWQYYNGNNVTINNVKRYYYSDPKKAIVGGKEVTVGGGLTENKFVANYKIGWGIYKDIVTQKVNTLLDEIPNINTTYKLDDKLLKNIGYALKVAGIRAAAQGIGYIYQDRNGKLVVFESENCIAYCDDITGKLKALIRFWEVNYKKSNKNVIDIYFEVYEDQYMTRYKKTEGGIVVDHREFYKYKKIIDIDAEQIISESFGIPITVFRNNEKYQSDMSVNLRGKIDAIDIVNSGFANNIEDFSEIYWIVKKDDLIDSAGLEDFVSNISRTKKIVIEGNDPSKMSVDTKQVEIPTTARVTFVADRKKEVIEESGIIDIASLTGGSLTQIAIKAATLRLRQRMSDFEWEAYETVNDILLKYQLYNKIAFDFDVDFTEMLIQNDTEMLDNLLKIKDTISKRSALEIIKRAGYIQDIAEEQELINEEVLSDYTLGDDDGQNTSTDGQIT